MAKVGLVLEGGSMRAMFTAGVIDTFLDENIEIDGIIGTSAGALFSPNFFSHQKGRALRYNKRFCKSHRYMGMTNFLFTGDIINKKMAYYDMSTKYDIFDNETFLKTSKPFYVTATNVHTGKAEYLQLKDPLRDMEMLRATAALPFFSNIVEVEGKYYLDGGITDSVPIKKCQELGFEKIIVVLTQPLDYRKKAFSEVMMKALKWKYKKYPKLLEALSQRYQMYNNTIDYILDLEKKGEIFVLRPSTTIHLKTIERNPDDLQAVYDQGVQECLASLDALKTYLTN